MAEILVSDANVLIDIEIGNLSPHIFQLPHEIVVPDILFELELKDRHARLLQMGLKVKSLNPESIRTVGLLTKKHPRPSTNDRFALSLAIQEKCPLLTGDKALRLAAKAEGVEVHGSLWLVQQILDKKLITHHQAKTSFDSMKAHGSRLPWGEVEKLLT